jgi:hypothetical protein
MQDLAQTPLVQTTFSRTPPTLFGISFPQILEDELPILDFPKSNDINSAKRFYQ